MYSAQPTPHHILTDGGVAHTSTASCANCCPCAADSPCRAHPVCRFQRHISAMTWQAASARARLLKLGFRHHLARVSLLTLYPVQVYFVAQDTLTTYNGLNTSCSPVSTIAAPASGCPTAVSISCQQVSCAAAVCVQQAAARHPLQDVVEPTFHTTQWLLAAAVPATALLGCIPAAAHTHTHRLAWSQWSPPLLHPEGVLNPLPCRLGCGQTPRTRRAAPMCSGLCSPMEH